MSSSRHPILDFENRFVERHFSIGATRVEVQVTHVPTGEREFAVIEEVRSEERYEAAERLERRLLRSVGQ